MWSNKKWCVERNKNLSVTTEKSLKKSNGRDFQTRKSKFRCGRKVENIFRKVFAPLTRPSSRLKFWKAFLSPSRFCRLITYHMMPVRVRCPPEIWLLWDHDLVTPFVDWPSHKSEQELRFSRFSWLTHFLKKPNQITRKNSAIFWLCDTTAFSLRYSSDCDRGWLPSSSIALTSKHFSIIWHGDAHKAVRT